MTGLAPASNIHTISKCNGIGNFQLGNDFTCIGIGAQKNILIVLLLSSFPECDDLGRAG
ncbi:hypothetical protein [Psychromonas sp.]|uniref:hypothetical protein n=1 Tax=Psychromonas sp. TaxID=1884585 RepID=UPI0039E4BE9E